MKHLLISLSGYAATLTHRDFDQVMVVLHREVARWRQDPSPGALILGDGVTAEIVEADLTDVAHGFLLKCGARPSGLYMIEPHAEGDYPQCDRCASDAHWDLEGRWCSRHFAEEARRQRAEGERALRKAVHAQHMGSR